MKQLTTSSLKQGYITIPRALLNRQATDGRCRRDRSISPNPGAHQLFRPVPYDINGTIILCKRGDSLISYHHWSNIFGWTRPKTTRFFQRLAKGGIIDLTLIRKRYSISVSPTLIFGPDVSLRKPKTPERKKSPQTSTFSGTNTTP